MRLLPLVALFYAADPTIAFAQLCGDGVLDPGEECDDGNSIPGDTCTSCQCGCGTLTTSTHLTCDINAIGPGNCVVLGAPGIELQCDGHAISGDGSGSGNSTGVAVSGHDGVTVRGCSISGFKFGARLENSSSSLVGSNRFANNTLAVSVSASGADSLDDVAVSRNFIDIPPTGFASGIGMFAAFGTGNTIAWNIIQTRGFSGTGISLGSAAETVVSNNTISTAPTASSIEGIGIALHEGASAKTLHTNILRTLRVGIELGDAATNVLQGNTLENNMSGVLFSSDTAQDNILRNNRITKYPSELGLDFMCFTEDCYANDIDPSNTINTRPIHHYDGAYAPCPTSVGPMKSGRLDLVRCANAVATGIAMDNGDGIHLVYPYGGRVVGANIARSPFGVAAHYGTDVLFDDNSFTNIAGPAMYLKCGIRFNATNNKINGGAATGIWGLHLLDSQITYNEIKNLGPFVLNSELGGALQLTAGSSRNLVAWNRITDNAAYGIFFVGAWFFEATTDNLVTKNYVLNNAAVHGVVDLKMCGHSLDGSDRLSNNNIVNNIFTSGDMFPMEICDPPVCDNNTVSGNIENGVIFVDDGDGCSG